MSAIATRLSSPRAQRRLLWAGGAALVVGVVVAVSTFVWTNPKVAPPAPGNGHVQKPVTQKTVPFEPSARKVGERFIRTAVMRKNLGASWQLIDARLRGGFTLKQWKTGNIPVVPYPADLSQPAPVKISWSYKNDAMLLILLRPKPGDPTKPQLFHLGLHAFGTGAKRHWLVDYWAPFGAPKIPQN